MKYRIFQCRKSFHRRFAFSLVLIACVFMVSACGSVDFQAGKRFDTAVLEVDLQPGVSNKAQVERFLGTPYGRGKALMPFHEAPRTVWSYYFEQGKIDLGGDDTKDRRKYLFIFFNHDIYEGYMWFDNRLEGRKTANTAK